MLLLSGIICIMGNAASYGSEKVILKGHKGCVTSIDISADGYCFLTTTQKTVRLWNALGVIERSFTSNSVFDSAIFSPNCSSIAITTCDSSVIILNPKDFSIRHTIGLNSYGCIPICIFSPCSRYIIVGCGNELNIWLIQFHTKKPVQPIITLSIPSISALAVHPCGFELSVGTKDGLVFVYQFVDNIFSLARSPVGIGDGSDAPSLKVEPSRPLVAHDSPVISIDYLKNSNDGMSSSSSLNGGPLGQNSKRSLSGELNQEVMGRVTLTAGVMGDLKLWLTPSTASWRGWEPLCGENGQITIVHACRITNAKFAVSNLSKTSIAESIFDLKTSKACLKAAHQLVIASMSSMSINAEATTSGNILGLCPSELSSTGFGADMNQLDLSYSPSQVSYAATGGLNGGMPNGAFYFSTACEDGAVRAFAVSKWNAPLISNANRHIVQGRSFTAKTSRLRRLVGRQASSSTINAQGIASAPTRYSNNLGQDKNAVLQANCFLISGAEYLSAIHWIKGVSSIPLITPVVKGYRSFSNALMKTYVTGSSSKHSEHVAMAAYVCMVIGDGKLLVGGGEDEQVTVIGC